VKKRWGGKKEQEEKRVKKESLRKKKKFSHRKFLGTIPVKQEEQASLDQQRQAVGGLTQAVNKRD